LSATPRGKNNAPRERDRGEKGRVQGGGRGGGDEEAISQVIRISGIV